MNSSQWRYYPKGADFPKVAECPDCHGTGLRISKKWSPNFNTWNTERGQGFYIECTRCVGTGKVIPPEWISDGSGQVEHR